MPSGRLQIIPGVGAHTQHYVTPPCVQLLMDAGLVYYAADYGPDARVFRPTAAYWDADTETIDAWIKFWAFCHAWPQKNLQITYVQMMAVDWRNTLREEGDALGT